MWSRADDIAGSKVEGGDQRAESREQRAESREQRAESRTLGSESEKQKAKSKEQRASMSVHIVPIVGPIYTFKAVFVHKGPVPDTLMHGVRGFPAG